MKKCMEAGCSKEAVAVGLCPKHYRRLRKYGDSKTVRIEQFHGLSIKDRLLARLKSNGECIEWTGYRDPNGYGRMNIDNIPVLVHRIAWEVFNGPIPDGLYVLHKCDNPPCVRSDHLFLGTQSDNNHDCINKGRMRHFAHKGEDHWIAKLTEKQAIEIINSSEKGVILAKRYGVSPQNICDIRKRKIWKHLS